MNLFRFTIFISVIFLLFHGLLPRTPLFLHSIFLYIHTKRFQFLSLLLRFHLCNSLYQIYILNLKNFLPYVLERFYPFFVHDFSLLYLQSLFLFIIDKIFYFHLLSLMNITLSKNLIKDTLFSKKQTKRVPLRILCLFQFDRTFTSLVNRVHWFFRSPCHPWYPRNRNKKTLPRTSRGTKHTE